MAMVIETINRAGEIFYDFSLGMIIQSSVLIVALFIIDWVIRKRVRAVVRYGLWMVLLVKLVLPPSLCLPTGIGYWCAPQAATRSAPDAIPAAMPSLPVVADARINEQPDSTVAGVQADHSMPAYSIPLNQQQPKADSLSPSALTPVPQPASVTLQWQAILLLLWFGGVLLLTAMLIQRYGFVRALIAQSRPAPDHARSELARCQRQMGMRHPVDLRITANMLSPAACRLIKPVILLPESLLNELTPDKLRSVLIHELTHIQRGDLWINFFQTILQILYFYHPLLWLANTLIGRIREKAVDEAVLTHLGGQAATYSATLIDIAEIAFTRPRFSLRLVGIVESRHALQDRIKHIVSRPLPGTARVGIVGLLCVFIVAALLLPMARGQKQSLSPWLATLANGDTIELAGVSALANLNGPWWSPEGTPLAMEIAARDPGNYSSPDPGYCFFLRTTGTPSFKIDTIGGSQAISSIEVKQPSGLTGYRAHISSRQQTTRLRLAIATGLWKPLHTSDSPGGSTSATVDGKTVIFAGLVRAGADSIFSCSDELGYRNATRIIAVTADNRELTGAIETDTGVNTIRQRTIRFTGLAPDKISRIILQSCPYDYFTFKNIALAPTLSGPVSLDKQPALTGPNRITGTAISPAIDARTDQVARIPIDFDSYFPDSEDGAKTLAALWNDRDKDLRPADEILATVRAGLRRYPNPGNILRWVGNLFIWGKEPQNQQAMELMRQASGSPKREIYGDAIYFGLSVAKEKTPAIVQAMTAVAMKTEDYFNVTGRILWGCRNHETELIDSLEPYLSSTDPAIAAKARDVRDYFTDSKAFMARLAQRKNEAVHGQYGDKLDELKTALLTGDSATRKRTLQQLQSQGIMAIVDDSFLDGFQACVRDEDAEIRAEAARIMGGHYVWSGKPQNQRAIEILTGLLDDPERPVRTEAVYYGLSTVNNPGKDLLNKMLATILDDREINYYGRVIWNARRNTETSIEILQTWMDQSAQDETRAVKAYEIYEDVTGQPLPQKYDQQFAGMQSKAHEGLCGLCYSEQPIKKNALRETFVNRLTQAGLLGKVMDFYILEGRETATGLFTCATLSDRNAIRAALAQPPAFQVAGYIDGRIGPSGSGWIASLSNFRKNYESIRIALPVLPAK